MANKTGETWGEIKNRIMPTELIDALRYIGPVSLNVGIGFAAVVCAVLSAKLGGTQAWVLMMICAVPVATGLVFLALMVAIRTLLWAFTPSPPRLREASGRFAKINKNGRPSKSYLVVVDENGNNHDGVGG